MPISENLAAMIKRIKDEHQMSMLELSRELGISKSSLESYISGAGNPRANTLELLAEKGGVSVAELVSGLPSGWEEAEILLRAAKELGFLPPEQREQCVRLFLQLVAVLSETDHIKIKVKKGRKQEIRAYAQSQQKSLNQYIIDLIDREMKQR